MIDYQDLIGIQFEYGGRGPDAYDCYGLVMECLRRNGVEIPDYRSPTVLREIAELVANEKYRWRTVATKDGKEPIPTAHLQPGRVIEMRVNGLACHVGFINAPRWFLHTWEDSGGVVANELADWRDRILGVYEYGDELPSGLPGRAAP